MAALWAELIDGVPADRDGEAEAIIVEQTAPLASALGVALQGLSAPSVFEDPANLRLMSLLADDIGVGAPERSRFDRFRDMCRAQGGDIGRGAPSANSPISAGSGTACSACRRPSMR